MGELDRIVIIEEEYEKVDNLPVPPGFEPLGPRARAVIGRF